MNNFEVIRVLGRMFDYTKEISMNSLVYYIKDSLAIDKKSQ